MSYHGCGIAPLSQKQVSRILNGHPVRVALGKAHKMALSTEHAKKLHRAGLKGKGITVTLDPYAIMHNQHLRKEVGMLGRGSTSEGLKENAAGNAEKLMTASTDRAIKGIAGNGMHRMRHLRGRGSTSEGLKENAAGNAEKLMTASTDRAIRGISGNGVVGLVKKMAGAGKQSKALKAAAAQNAINLMTAAVDRGIKGIVGNGMTPAEQAALKSRMQGRGKSSPEKFREWTKAVGQVFLPLNRGAMGAAKRQLIEAGARAGEAYLENQVPGAQYQSAAPTAGETRKEKRQSRAPRAPRAQYYPPDEQSPQYEFAPDVPVAVPLTYQGEHMDLSDLPTPPTGFPKQRLYAAGMRKRAVKGKIVGGAFKNAGY